MSMTTPLRELIVALEMAANSDRVTISRTLAETLIMMFSQESHPDEHLKQYIKRSCWLTPTERYLLTKLTHSAGTPVSHASLRVACGAASGDSLQVHICRLRTKMADTWTIHSVSRVGYMLEEIKTHEN